MEKSGGLLVNYANDPELVDDYSYLPQHHQQTVTQSVTNQWSPQQYHGQGQSPPVNHQHDPANNSKKKICGLTPFQFIIVVLLTISIIVGAVLGGVFGSGVLHRTSSSSISSSDALSTPSFVGTNTPETITVATTRTTTRAATFTQSDSASETGISADYCNNNTYYYSTNPVDTYLILCSIDWPDDTIRHGTHVFDLKYLANQPTMAGCLQSCSTWDDQGDATRRCRAVVWNYRFQCFLKNQTGDRADTFYDYDPKYIQAGVLVT